MNHLWAIPESWRWVEFSDLGEIVSGGTPSTARDQLQVYRQAVLKHAFEGKLTAPPLEAAFGARISWRR
jgi:hypothetical protein